ncbi:FAD-binding protein [Klebsiella pneumoniae]|nr:FAD-binding protein [Klebsiella pneumoniae]
MTVLSKGPISEGSTFYALGGIAAVFDETDSIGIPCRRYPRRQRGTLRSSCGHLHSPATPDHTVQWLIDQGVLFDTQVQANGEESYHLTREGGHSHRRILHAADATGKAVETTLVDKALAPPNIRILERSNADGLNRIG